MKLSNKFFIISIIVILIIILYLLFRYYSLYVENYDNLGLVNVYNNKMSEAINIPNLNKWKFPNSMNYWYSIAKNGYQTTIKDMQIKPYSNISIVFFLQINSVFSEWRNIFHFTNDGNNCCDSGKGQRIPSLWVFPDKTTNLHLRFETSSNSNDGINTSDFSPNLELGKPYLLAIVLNGDSNKLNFYVNKTNISNNKSFSPIIKRNDNTILYIGDPWHSSDNGVLINNFTVYDGIISQDDVNQMVDKTLETPLIKGSPGSPGSPGVTGPMGPAGKDGGNGVAVPGPTGPAGVPGATGSIGPPGPTGSAGSIGPTGVAGSAGLVGAPGTIGPAGIDGPKGDKGDQGKKGDQGEKGDQGGQGPKGDLGAQGIPGKDGQQGPAGAIGPVGPAGVAGPAGAMGAQGGQGPVGIAGANNQGITYSPYSQ